MEKQDKRGNREAVQGKREISSARIVKVNKNEETIKIRSFDFSDLIEKFKFSLVGRKFHRDGRGTEALMSFMQKPRIWDVEGKFVGTDLGNDRFQMDFKEEGDMLKVLNKRPCHFNRWSFAIERWEPTIREDFPNKMLFWIQITGIPSHYKKNETYSGIGEALGEVKDVDVAGGRVQVLLNGDEPLQFVKKAEYDNGDIITVKLKYEDLHRYCFNCGKISHIEGDCPDLSEEEREQRRSPHVDQVKVNELSPRHRLSQVSEEKISLRKSDISEKKRVVGSFSPKKDVARYGDLRDDLQWRRDSRSKEIWKRIEYKDRDYNRENAPSYRERYHPYERQHKRQTYYDNKRPRYEFSYASSSKQPRFKGEREVNSGRVFQRSRRSFGERDEIIEVSDSQRTVTELRRADEGRSDFRGERNVDIRGMNRGEVFYSKDKKEKGTAFTQVVSGLYKQQWRKKVTQTLEEEKRMEKEDSGIAKAIDNNQRNTVFSERKQLENDEQKEQSSNDDEFQDVTPERDPLDETLDFPPLTADQEAEIDADLAAMDTEKGMNEEEIDNDDLLGEDFLQEQEQIEAISQLSPGPLITGLINDSTGIEKKKQKEKKVKPVKKQSSRAEKAIDANKGKGKEVEGAKKKIHHSPDLKGVSLRKSNVFRVRSSPLKKKGPMHVPSSTVSRKMVFPSAINKKAAAVSGSVVSQKPPSTQI